MMLILNLFSYLQVLITIYWLGRRAQSDRFYDGPYLNFKAFEGLLGTALYKVDSFWMGQLNHRDLSYPCCHVTKGYFSAYGEILFYSHCSVHLCVLPGIWTMCERKATDDQGGRTLVGTDTSTVLSHD